MSDIRVSDRISAAHPALPGHFPNNPIVPGVVLLDRVIAEAERQFGPVCGLVSTKFIAPLRPEIPFTVALLAGRPGLIDFRIEAGAEIIVSGVLEYTAQVR